MTDKKPQHLSVQGIASLDKIDTLIETLNAIMKLRNTPPTAPKGFNVEEWNRVWELNGQAIEDGMRYIPLYEGIPDILNTAKNMSRLPLLLKNVRRQCAVFQPINLVGDFGMAPIQCASSLHTPYNAVPEELFPPVASVLMNPYMLNFVSEEEVAAIMAHEIGHIVHEDSRTVNNWMNAQGIKKPEDYEWKNKLSRVQDAVPGNLMAEFSAMNYESEFGADDFARQKGYGLPMLNWLERLKATGQENAKSKTHPPLADRIARLAGPSTLALTA